MKNILKNKYYLGIFLILIYQINIGLSPLLMKSLSPALSGTIYVMLRFGISLIFLSVLFPFFKKHIKLPKITKKQIVGILLLGILGTGIASNLNLPAIQNLGVVIGSLVINMEIPIGIILGVILLKEKLNPKYIFFTILVFMGFLLIILFKDKIAFSNSDKFLTGLVAGIITALLYAVCTIIGKKLVKNISVSVVAYFRIFIGVIINTILLFGNNQLSASIEIINTLKLSDFIILAWLGIVTSALGLIMYYQALKLLEVKSISLFMTIAPVLSVLLGFISGESLAFMQIIGALLMLGGLAGVIHSKN